VNRWNVNFGTVNSGTVNFARRSSPDAAHRAITQPIVARA
jgi:hypothetical protein